MDEDERRIQAAKALCNKHNVSVIPYANAYWIKGSYVDFVTPHLECLKETDLMPRQFTER